MRSTVWGLFLAVLMLPPQAAGAPCLEALEPHLVIETEHGSLVVGLHTSAAPHAVRRLSRLALGPTFDAEVFGEQGRPSTTGYFDGLVFNEVRPRVEIVTSDRAPGRLIRLPTELDAETLGLDQERIESLGEAMDIAQLELSPTYKKQLKTRRATSRLTEWMQALYETPDPSFLVGVSRQEINEALGYSYSQGLQSLPVTRGAVSLKPLSPGEASVRLSIALADMPQRTGKWMVVGRVVEGLEIADEISARPMADPGATRSRNQPVRPVVLKTVRLDCR